MKKDEKIKFEAKKNEMPLAVVLHIAYTGYGVVRSLFDEGIPIIAFQKNLSPPEAKTKLCKNIITFNDEEELLQKMVNLAADEAKKPVLYITSDVYVEFFVKYREVLENLFLIHYPDSKIVNLLLKKNEFLEYAINNNLPIPKSIKILNLDDIRRKVNAFIFPAVVKPFSKSSQWLSAKLNKAYFVNNLDELFKLYRKVSRVDSCLLVQEWIPGPDSNIEYCLTYFNEKSKCIASFTGAKIRQWPVGTGSTASTEPKVNELILRETVEIFKKLNYRGFGSIEYKKHSLNGRYYIMEPTVGRPNQQSFIATANGLNMPLIAYKTLTGISLGENLKNIKPAIYIDEWADLASSLVHFIRRIDGGIDYIKLFSMKKAFRFFDSRDPKVFIHSLMKVLNFINKKVFRLQ